MVFFVGACDNNICHTHSVTRSNEIRDRGTHDIFLMEYFCVSLK